MNRERGSVKRDMGTRFWEKVQKTETCWLWTAQIAKNGYGRFKPEYIARQAHRVAYELLIGPIPDGLQLDHLCRVRHCVNPAHLEPVTGRENILRGFAPSACRARQTECWRGHPFDDVNTYRRTDGTRACRECNRDSVRRYKARLG
jgi:hypothetical protein